MHGNQTIIAALTLCLASKRVSTPFPHSPNRLTFPPCGILRGVIGCFNWAFRLIGWPTSVVFAVILLLSGGSFTRGSDLHLQLRHRLTAPEPLVGAGFGSSVEFFGNYLAISEPNRPDLDLGIRAAGQVHLYDLTSGAHLRTIQNPDPGTIGESFGAGLAIGDNKLFVGAPGLDESVYAFDLRTGNIVWSLTNPPIHGVSREVNFGRGLAFSDGRLLATIPSYVVPFQGILGGGFTIDAADGRIDRFFDNPEPNDGDTLGALRSYDIFDGKVALGSISDCKTPGQSGGCVWIFDQVSGDVVFRLDNPTPKPLPTINDLPDWFGVSVAGNADVIVVGDRLDEVKGYGAGGVYVFDAETGLLLHSLYSPHPQSYGESSNEEFGTDIDVTLDGRVWVGADSSIVNGQDYAGRVYLFDGATGQLLLEVQSPNSSAFSLFGNRVTAWGDMVAITAAGEGAVYLYAIVPEPRTWLTILPLIFLTCVRTRRTQVMTRYTKGFSHVQAQPFDEEVRMQ
jgi:outer membrane protein assembly factor BamB